MRGLQTPAWFTATSGNLTSDGTSTFVYDVENRPIPQDPGGRFPFALRVSGSARPRRRKDPLDGRAGR
ncbi:MAG: hypothetical protein ACXWUZ_09175, partial [Allosphingosinicella sp.]